MRLPRPVNDLLAWIWPSRFVPYGVTVRSPPRTPEELEQLKREFMEEKRADGTVPLEGVRA